MVSWLWFEVWVVVGVVSVAGCGLRQMVCNAIVDVQWRMVSWWGGCWETLVSCGVGA